MIEETLRDIKKLKSLDVKKKFKMSIRATIIKITIIKFDDLNTKISKKNRTIKIALIIRNKTINRKVSTRKVTKTSLCDKNKKKNVFDQKCSCYVCELKNHIRIDLICFKYLKIKKKSSEILMFLVEMLNIENRKRKFRAFMMTIFIRTSQKVRMI